MLSGTMLSGTMLSGTMLSDTQQSGPELPGPEPPDGESPDPGPPLTLSQPGTATSARNMATAQAAFITIHLRRVYTPDRRT
jgi:hypothetical protein